MKKIALLVFCMFALSLSASAEIVVSPAFTKNLKYGMKNDSQVLLLQRVLMKQGFLASNAFPQGNFTTRTKSAVKEFQRANFLYPDGAVGYRTRLVLNKIFFDNPRYLETGSVSTQYSSQNYAPTNQVQTGNTSPWNVSGQTSLGGFYSTSGYSFSNYYSQNTTGQPSLVINYPSPSSSYVAGQSLPISWSATNFSNSVTMNISLVEPSGFGNAVRVVSNIAFNTQNDSYEAWTIPTNISGNNFYILIEAIDSSNNSRNISAISSGAFSITAPSSGTTGSSTSGSSTTGTGSTTGSGTSSSTTGTTGTTSTSGTTGSSSTTGSGTGNSSVPPYVTSYSVPISSITQTSADIEGSIDTKGLTTTAWVEYGTSSASLSSKSSITSVSSYQFKQSLSNLFPNTTYYFRICAKNSAGTTCSTPIISFMTTMVASSGIPMPDLIIETYSITPTTLTLSSSNKTISYSFSLKNVGNADLYITKNSEFAIYKKDNVGMGGTVKIASYYLAQDLTLKKGAVSSKFSGTSSSTVNVASSLGTFDIVLIADNNNLITESDTQNNSISKQIKVSAGSSGGSTTTTGSGTTTGSSTTGGTTGGSSTGIGATAGGTVGSGM